jgi:hypothetical protein
LRDHSQTASENAAFVHNSALLCDAAAVIVSPTEHMHQRLAAEALGGGAVPAVVVGLNLGTAPHDTAMASAGDAVVGLVVSLGEHVSLEGASITDITLSSGFDDVLNLETANGLVLLIWFELATGLFAAELCEQYRTLGVQRPQPPQRIALTWPRPFFLRPLLRLLKVIL